MSDSSKRIQAIEPMYEQARQAAGRAYAPYSQFPVGAALKLKDGTMLQGCNVENASFGLCNCAERTVIFSAIAQGKLACDFDSLLIYMPGDSLYSPCGACRQVIVEFFAADALIYATCDTEQMKVWRVDALLPGVFKLP
ncbi:cytidine deaminase [Bowmanella denitrificans]|uniref:Cytidine deaminase n=1 Tax=Bowmanella denitrificans TaxID=366582 RepID=A0ABN0WSM5_9ALTE|nr:cytidine deaminase [Bowmanella denitrificans]